MNKVGSKSAPTAADFKQAAKTAKKVKKVKQMKSPVWQTKAGKSAIAAEIEKLGRM